MPYILFLSYVNFKQNGMVLKPQPLQKYIIACIYFFVFYFYLFIFSAGTQLQGIP